MQNSSKKIQRIGKPAFGIRTNEYVYAISFGKLAIQIQQELSTAGKMDTSTDEIKDLNRRRFQ